jgi:predicted small secreted protein
MRAAPRWTSTTTEDAVVSNSKTRSIRLLLLALAASAFSTLGFGGCNTAAGMREDVEAAGDAIEDKAQETEPY